ncbi:MAG: hypothetical protein EZS26_001960 [Candidatus Ordinivivax streblomastigis]|uniref:Uncharacterized protein n=1 Tax=Candidatus Ordinivivax streblomastigis TaxID=2540710 RepID=A0A5M8P0K3_9BACT|nr:MAG: hypothetical protein EZS26_001960 [Candidatus Ordinivivax streblomastigis]
MISRNLINKTIAYFEKYSNESFVVTPSLPILYFGDLSAYQNSELKVITVGKNPSSIEFSKTKEDENFSFFRFPLWNNRQYNLVEALNEYFEVDPYMKWFSCFEPILKGMQSSYRSVDGYPNIALHTDICSPLATKPTWTILKREQQKSLFEEGFEIWKELIEELQPDVMLISVPRVLLHGIAPTGKELITFDKTKNGGKRKTTYVVTEHIYPLRSGKVTKIIFGQAANKPFDTISSEQKVEIGQTIINNFNL